MANDPKNQEQRPFQGGTDSLAAPPTQAATGPKRSHAQYAKFEASDVTSVSEATTGDSGASPAMMSEPDVGGS